jgi:Arc-like DNA binding domain
MAKKTQTAQVKVRMPKDLQRKIQRDADRHGQTINAEILRRLETSYQSDKLFEGILAPHNAKLVRMIGQAAILAGDWRGNKIKFNALEDAITWILYAGAMALLKREREEFAKAKPSKEEIRKASDESNEMGNAIAQIVIANEMPQQSAREVIQEHALSEHRREQRAKIYWGREETPLLKLRQFQTSDKKRDDQ